MTPRRLFGKFANIMRRSEVSANKPPLNDMPCKAPCPTCTEGGRPGYIWQKQRLIPCWTCGGSSWIKYPQAYVGAARPDSEPGTVACLYVERAKGAFYIVDLDAYRANQISIDLHKLVPVKATPK